MTRELIAQQTTPFALAEQSFIVAKVKERIAAVAPSCGGQGWPPRAAARTPHLRARDRSGYPPGRAGVRR